MNVDTTKVYAVAFLVVFTVYDILINRIFWVTGIWNHIWLYYLATWVVLTPTLIILFAVATKNMWFPIYSFIFIYGGWLDILFFWLQLQPLPARYTWLPHQPTNIQIILIASVLTASVYIFEQRMKGVIVAR